jgi:hypothetical protein
MNKLNLTLDVTFDNKLMSVTFYKIDALGKAKDNSSIIFLGGKEFYCAMPYGQLWEKLKKHESTL